MLIPIKPRKVISMFFWAECFVTGLTRTFLFSSCEKGNFDILKIPFFKIMMCSKNLLELARRYRLSWYHCVSGCRSICTCGQHNGAKERDDCNFYFVHSEPLFIDICTQRAFKLYSTLKIYSKKKSAFLKEKLNFSFKVNYLCVLVINRAI